MWYVVVASCAFSLGVIFGACFRAFHTRDEQPPESFYDEVDYI